MRARRTFFRLKTARYGYDNEAAFWRVAFLPAGVGASIYFRETQERVSRSRILRDERSSPVCTGAPPDRTS
jgi:hypothetical protein